MLSPWCRHFSRLPFLQRRSYARIRPHIGSRIVPSAAGSLDNSNALDPAGHDHPQQPEEAVSWSRYPAAEVRQNGSLLDQAFQAQPQSPDAFFSGKKFRLQELEQSETKSKAYNSHKDLDSSEPQKYTGQHLTLSNISNDELSSPPSDLQTNQMVTSLPPSLLWDIWETAPPSADDLRAARSFFTSHPAQLSFSAEKLFEIPFTHLPEVAFIGRTNVGKSSLVNRLFGSHAIAKVSQKPHKTKQMNAYTLVPAGQKLSERNGLISVLDTPGFGPSARREWGEHIMRYLQKRKELRRVFVLMDCIDERKRSIRVTDRDLAILHDLATLRIPHQIIIMKVDRCLFPKELREPLTGEKLAPHVEQLRRAFAAVRERIFEAGAGNLHVDMRRMPHQPERQLLGVAADNASRFGYLSDEGKVGRGALGIDAVRWAILQATGLSRMLPSEVKKEKERQRLEVQRKGMVPRMGAQAEKPAINQLRSKKGILQPRTQKSSRRKHG